MMAEAWPDDPIVPQQPPLAAAWPDDPIVSGAEWPDDPVIAGPGSASILDYPSELGKAAIRGGAAGLGAALQGLGARQAATEPILGQRLDESVVGALVQGRLPQVIQAPGTGQRRSIAETGPYQAGQALTKAAEEALPSQKILPQLVEDVAGGVGQVGTNIATAMIPGVGPGLAVASVLAQGPGEQAERAVKAGATPEQQDIATSLAVIPGATEFVDLLLPKLGSLGATLSLIKRMGVKVFAGFAAEGTQEAAQQFLQNAIEQGVYNPARELGEGVPYSALVGGLTGGVVGAAMPGRRQPQVEPSPSVGTVEEAYGATVEPQLLLPPPSITPAEAAAGLEPPPRDLGPAPITVGVPEEVNVAAARVVEAPLPTPVASAPLEIELERPLDLTNEQVRVAAGNFGLLRYATYDPETELVHVTPAFNISPGQKPTGTRLRVPQDEINPRNVIIHSNTAVNPTGGPLTPGGPRVDIVEAAVAKFGSRFHDYALSMGSQFRALRDVVAGIPETVVAQRGVGVPRDYRGLLNEGIGVSFDPRYHGVNVKVPVAASFINIGMPKHTDPLSAARGMFYTMAHELSHHTHRTEHRIEDVMAEMIDHLVVHPTFNLKEFQQGLVDIVAGHHDVMMWMRGMYADGNVETIGKPLPVGREQGRGRRGPGDMGDPASRAGSLWGSTLSDWAALGAAGAGRVTDGKFGGATTASVGGYAGKPDFGLASNQRAINREVGHRGSTAYQQTPETQGARQAINTVFDGDMPQAVAAQAAHADHINWLYKWGGGLLDLVQRNLRFEPLVRYAELARLWHNLESQVQDAAVTIAKRWRSLGNLQSDALTKLFDDLTNMLYLTPQERAAGVVRNPTQLEFNTIANRYRVGREALQVYTDVRRFFTTYLQLVAQNAKDAAARTISDPVALSKALNEINAWVVTLQKRPYFPFMRFGSHYIHAKDANGHTVFFGLYERKGVLSARQVQLNMLPQVQRQFPTATVDVGVMPEDARPFYGLPPSLLKMIHQKMNLTAAQIDALEQLQFQMSPEMSFRHRFQHKGYTPGYSRDFLRAFSHYAFHGARYYAKTKYVWDMEDQIKAARAVGGDKATRIANYMDDHLRNTMLNLTGDHGLLKGFAFNWHLAFMPSSAFVNLTQTPLVTGPFLGSKFGDIRAVRAMSNAMRKLSSYYRKGSYTGVTEFELRALGVGMKWGVVSETQASELSALGHGNGMLMGVGGTEAQRAMQWFQQKGALMFETAEQFNRRIAFRAALELAMGDQTNKYVDEAVLKNPTMYSDLVNGVNTGAAGRFSPQEARAIVTAFDTVEQTQFVYSRFARPRFMRGKWSGALTVFMRYQQGILFLLLNENRGYRWRYLMTAAMLGGLSGLMGYDELKDLFEGVFKRMGYDLNVDREIRKYVKQFTGSVEAADYVLHGWARRGFGVPHILDGLGSYATGRPGRGLLDPPNLMGENVAFPMLDMSRSITPKLLPVQVGKLIAPYQDPSKAIAEQGVRASGAVFSVGFNILKALMGSKEEFTDTKRWEKAVPRAIGSASKAFRTFTEERERFGSARPASARTLLKYDVRDPEQVMEIIARGMGFNTLRESREWDFTKAKLEHKQFVEGSRKLLMEQMFEAIKVGDPKEKESVIEDIKKFNERVRGTEDRGYAITSENLRQGMRSRAKELELSERGLSARKREIPAIQELRELYPSAVEVKRR